MTKYERLVSLLEDMNHIDLIEIHNEYCDLTDYGDDHIYCMEELNELLENCGYTPIDIIQKAFYGDFNPNDDYFFFNGYANLVSFSYRVPSLIDIEGIADFAIRNNEDFDNKDIFDILESEEEDNEEE